MDIEDLYFDISDGPCVTETSILKAFKPQYRWNFDIEYQNFGIKDILYRRKLWCWSTELTYFNYMESAGIRNLWYRPGICHVHDHTGHIPGISWYHAFTWHTIQKAYTRSMHIPGICQLLGFRLNLYIPGIYLVYTGNWWLDTC